MTDSRDSFASGVDERYDDLVEEIATELEAGRRVDLEDQLAQYPQYADKLQRVIPAMQAMFDLGMESVNSRPRPSSVEATSGTLGDYRIVREIGRGGMGVVYEAEQISLQRSVALKVLPFAAMLDQKALQRFRNEVRAAATLEHPHIVSVYSTGEQRGVYYYAMQLIRGRPLDAIVAEMRQLTREGQPLHEETINRVTSGVPTSKAARSDSPQQAPGCALAAETPTEGGSACPPADVKQQSFIPTKKAGSTDRDVDYFRAVVQWGIQAAEALQHAHEHGIVHRDVKPGNFILDAAGQLHVTDFGLARVESNPGMTMTGDLLGTLRYMSPEQASGERQIVDHRSDIYSLGATLYEMLCLEPAFGGRDRVKLLRQIKVEDPPSLRSRDARIPRDLETIVRKAMAKDPADRYRSARALSDDLWKYSQGEPIEARRPTLMRRSALWFRRHPVVTASAVASLMVALVTLAVGSILLLREQRNTLDALQALQTQKQTAVANAERAEKNFRMAQKAAERAERSSRAMQQARYVSDMNLAGQAMRRGDVRQTVQILERSLPVDEQDDLRDFAWNYLWRSTHRPGKEYLQHTDDVRSLSLSRDGRLLASAGEQGEIHICDAATGTLIRSLSADTNFLGSIDFSPDGSKLVSAEASGTLRVWDVEKGIQLWSVEAHQSSNHPQQVAWTADGQQLVSAGGGSVIQVRDANNGKRASVLEGHKGLIFDLAVSRKQPLMASAGGDQDPVVRLWNIHDARPLHVLKGHSNRLTSVTFSPDGRFLASGSTDKTTRLWRVADGELVKTWSYIDEPRCVRFSPDSKWLAVGSSVGNINLQQVVPIRHEPGWHTMDPPAWQAHQGKVRSIAFSPTGDQLFSCGSDGCVRAWLPWADPVKRRLPLRQDPTHDVAFSQDGQTLFVLRGNGIQRWDLADYTQLPMMNGEERERWSIGVSRDYQWAAVAGTPGRIGIWNLKEGVLHRTLDVGDSTNQLLRGRCAFSPDGHILAVPNRHQNSLQLFSLDSGEFVSRLPAPTCNDTLFTSDGRHVLVDSLNEILIWDLQSREIVRRLTGHTNTVRDLALGPEGNLLASASNDRSVRIWDLKSGQEKFCFTGHQHHVLALAFSHDGQHLVSGDRSGSVRVWHLPTGRFLCELIKMDTGIQKLRFSPEGRYLACPRANGSLSLLNFTSEPLVSQANSGN